MEYIEFYHVKDSIILLLYEDFHLQMRTETLIFTQQNMSGGKLELEYSVGVLIMFVFSELSPCFQIDN